MAKKVTKKITDKELKELVDLRNKNVENLTVLGNTDYQILTLEEKKWEIKTQITETEEQYKKALTSLRDNYGDVNIDLETGKITEVKENLEATTK